MARSLGTTLGVIRATAKISIGTLVDAFRGGPTTQATEDRLAWWGTETERIAEIDLRIEGKVPDGPETFIVMSNHQSHFDIPVLFRAVSPRIRMVTKAELFRIPIWGRAMHASGFISIDRKNRERARESLARAKKTMQSGIHVWIAPEGTRSRNGDLGPFKKGGFILAAESGIRILPIGLWGTRDVLAPSQLAATKGARVAVVIGQPIDVEGKDKEGLLSETQIKMTELLERAKTLAAS